MVNLKELRAELKVLTRRKRLYKVLKEDLKQLGYWRNKPRGNPEKGKIRQAETMTNPIFKEGRGSWVYR